MYLRNFHLYYPSIGIIHPLNKSFSYKGFQGHENNDERPFPRYNGQLSDKLQKSS